MAGLRQGPGRAAESMAVARIYGHVRRDIRVVVPAFGSCGDVEPVVGLAVRLRELGAEARVCAPPNCWTASAFR